jgi:hypothetical protein
MFMSVPAGRTLRTNTSTMNEIPQCDLHTRQYRGYLNIGGDGGMSKTLLTEE